MSAPDRRAKLDRAHGDLSIRRQCAMLGLARSGVYRKPRPVNDNDLEAMRRIDALFTARPVFGARRIRADAERGGFSDRPEACATADAGDGDRGAGAEAENDQARAGTQDLSLPLARSDDRSAEPCFGQPISPTSRSAAAFSIWSPSSTGRAGQFFPGDCRTRWTRPSVWRRSRTRWPDTADRDLQHGPGQPIHRRGLHWRADRGRSAHFDGRTPDAGSTTCPVERVLSAR